MDTILIEKINELHVKVHAEPSIKMELSDHFTFPVPGAQFMPAYKNKVWDGKLRMLNVMTGLIYTGLTENIVKFSKQRGYDVKFKNFTENEESYPSDYGYSFSKEIDTAFEVRDYQNMAFVKGINNNRALFLSPTASGKSFIIYLLSAFHAMRDRKILIVVPTISLVHQMSSDFLEYNKKRPLRIHKITAGVDKSSDSDFVISTWQSIFKMPKKWFEQFDVIIGDEAHNFKSKSLVSIMEKIPDVKYRYGFTGTLEDTLTNKMVLEGLFGPVYQVTTTKTLIDNKTLADFRIEALVLGYDQETRKANTNKDYPSEIDWIVKNEARNKFIRNLAWSLKGNTLILFQFVEKHGKVLYPMLQKEDKTVHFIHGSVKAEDREEVRAIAEMSDDNIILASYGTFSTGTNIKKLDNIIFASPSKGKIRNLQSIGRVLRKGNGKESAVLYDIVDDLQWKNKKNFAVQHFMKRMEIYSEEGFDVKIFNVNLKG
jgi:superfamily II DNA or RNA helicase